MLTPLKRAGGRGQKADGKNSTSRGYCACRKRPRGRRAAEQRDELASFHVWMAPAWQEKM